MWKREARGMGWTLAMVAGLGGCSFQWRGPGGAHGETEGPVGVEASSDEAIAAIDCPPSLRKPGQAQATQVRAQLSAVQESGSDAAYRELWNIHCTYPDDAAAKEALDVARGVIQERERMTPAVEKALALFELRRWRDLPGGEVVAQHQERCRPIREERGGLPEPDADPATDLLTRAACGVSADALRQRAWFWMSMGEDGPAVRAAAFVSCEDVDQDRFANGYLEYVLCRADLTDRASAERAVAEVEVGNVYARLMLRRRWDRASQAMQAMGEASTKHEADFPVDAALVRETWREVDTGYAEHVAPWHGELRAAWRLVREARRRPGVQTDCAAQVGDALRRYVREAQREAQVGLSDALREPVGYALSDALAQCYDVDRDDRAHALRFATVGAEPSHGRQHAFLRQLAKKTADPKNARRSDATDVPRALTEKVLSWVREPIAEPRYDSQVYAPSGWTREVVEPVAQVVPVGDGVELRFRRNVVMGEYEVGCRNDYGRPIQIDRHGTIHYEQVGCRTEHKPVDLTLEPVAVPADEGEAIRRGDVVAITWKQQSRSKAPRRGRLLRIERGGVTVWLAGLTPEP